MLTTAFRLQRAGVAILFGITGKVTSGEPAVTGRFVVSEIIRRRFTPIAVARDAAKLAELGFAARGITVRQASIEDKASLDRAFGGAAAIVNCAGPFLETAKAVAQPRFE